MGLLEIIVVLAIIIIVFWAFNKLEGFIPEPIRTIAFVVLVILAVLFIASQLGVNLKL